MSPMGFVALFDPHSPRMDLPIPSGEPADREGSLPCESCHVTGGHVVALMGHRSDSSAEPSLDSGPIFQQACKLRYTDGG
jgi:hypothetical protein